MTATRLPVRSRSAGQRDGCMTSPSKRSRPSKCGNFGLVNVPDRVDDGVGFDGLDAVGRVDLEHPDVAVFVERRPLEVVARTACSRRRRTSARRSRGTRAPRRPARSTRDHAVVLLEAELVGDRDRVDPDVGVAVDGPRATGLGLALEQRRTGCRAAPAARAVARPLKPLPMIDDLEARRAARGLPSVQSVDEREVLERGELAAGLELEVAHRLLGRHVHEHAQLGLGRLARACPGRRGRPSHADGLVDRAARGRRRRA